MIRVNRTGFAFTEFPYTDVGFFYGQYTQTLGNGDAQHPLPISYSRVSSSSDRRRLSENK